MDYEEFNKFVLDLDRRLSAIISQAFDDCNSLNSVFKVINVYIFICFNINKLDYFKSQNFDFDM